MAAVTTLVVDPARKRACASAGAPVRRSRTPAVPVQRPWPPTRTRAAEMSPSGSPVSAFSRAEPSKSPVPRTAADAPGAGWAVAVPVRGTRSSAGASNADVTARRVCRARRVRTGLIRGSWGRSEGRKKGRRKEEGVGTGTILVITADRGILRGDESRPPRPPEAPPRLLGVIPGTRPREMRARDPEGRGHAAPRAGRCGGPGRGREATGA